MPDIRMLADLFIRYAPGFASRWESPHLGIFLVMVLHYYVTRSVGQDEAIARALRLAPAKRWRPITPDFDAPEAPPARLYESFLRALPQKGPVGAPPIARAMRSRDFVRRYTDLYREFMEVRRRKPSQEEHAEQLGLANVETLKNYRTRYDLPWPPKA